MVPRLNRAGRVCFSTQLQSVLLKLRDGTKDLKYRLVLVALDRFRTGITDIVRAWGLDVARTAAIAAVRPTEKAQEVSRQILTKQSSTRKTYSQKRQR